jgi:hypothetical protein
VRWPWQRRDREERAGTTGARGPVGYTGERLLLDPSLGRWFDAGGNGVAARRMAEVLDRRAPTGSAARGRVDAALRDVLPADVPDEAAFEELLAAAYGRLGPTRAEMLTIAAVRGDD